MTSFDFFMLNNTDLFLMGHHMHIESDSNVSRGYIVTSEPTAVSHVSSCFSCVLAETVYEYTSKYVCMYNLDLWFK